MSAGGESRRAIIADIHANTEALQVVLEDIRARGIGEIICLGDIVGYGPDPGACIDLVAEHCRLTMCGNHDYALLNHHSSFNPIAEQSLDCTREIMLKNCLDDRLGDIRTAFLRGLPEVVDEGAVKYVHASPRDPITEYLLESDVTYHDYEKIIENICLVEHLCFVGHTHVPGIITEDLRFLRPTNEQHRFPITGHRMIINPGSVGQPRDGDTRTSYCEVSGREIIFHRLEYDYAETQRKISALGCMHALCANRLAEGR